jgi:hypothetical protein
MQSAEKVKPEDALGVKQLFDFLNYEPKTGAFTWRVDMQRGGKAGDVAGNVNCRGYCNSLPIESRGQCLMASGQNWT